MKPYVVSASSLQSEAPESDADSVILGSSDADSVILGTSYADSLILKPTCSLLQEVPQLRRTDRVFVSNYNTL